MSVTVSFIAQDRLFSIRRIKAAVRTYPEWRAWFLSLLVWGFLVSNAFTATYETRNLGNIIYCMPAGNGLQSISKEESVSYNLLSTISNSLVPWMIMIIAMMYPLLNEPIRHVAFSVKKTDRNFGIFSFLLGYTITWTIAGVLFVSLLFFVNKIMGDQTPFVNGLIQASGFLIAATLVWLPGRAAKMTRCARTMPIRIHGWRLFWDSLHYGLRAGFTCLNICWALMVALMLTRHNFVLMSIVAIILLYERYLIKHTNRFPGHAWAILGLTLFFVEVFV